MMVHWHFILRVSTLSRPLQPGREIGKRKDNDFSNSVKMTRGMTLFFSAPLHPPLLDFLSAANVSWKRSIGGSHRAGGGPAAVKACKTLWTGSQSASQPLCKHNRWVVVVVEGPLSPAITSVQITHTHRHTTTSVDNVCVFVR